MDKATDTWLMDFESIYYSLLGVSAFVVRHRIAEQLAKELDSPEWAKLLGDSSKSPPRVDRPTRSTE